MGVYLHAAAGDVVMNKYGHEGVTATKLIRNLGTAWRRILQPESASDTL
jgi:NAD(P)H-hydrate repair Nnr-like enzyme with NAD(P)H-hydrate dehydratase domain